MQLTAEEKRDLFRLLVESQDSGTTVAESRQQLANKFGLSVPEVVQIEREGIANNWPPLDISFPSPTLLAEQQPADPAQDGSENV